jgi:hypothetical protein
MLISLLSCAGISAQAVNNQIKDVVMPSANAASLGKYGDIPVGYYTGVPSVGIPIHTIQEGSVSLPISLSYHAGGLKVGEPNSWVGLGWSLSAGGIISRTVQGKADESVNGYLQNGKFVQINAAGCIVNANYASTLPSSQFNSEIAAGRIDGEPDIFNFSIGGYSGKFYIDVDMTDDNVVNGKVVLIPKQDLKVEYAVSPSSSVTRLYKFTITTPNGIKYEFGNATGDNITDVNNDAIEITKPLFDLSERYATSWYLKRIVSIDGLDVINLNYKKENYRYGYRASASASGAGSLASPKGGYRASVIDIIGCRLERITTSEQNGR